MIKSTKTWEYCIQHKSLNFQTVEQDIGLLSIAFPIGLLGHVHSLACYYQDKIILDRGVGGGGQQIVPLHEGGVEHLSYGDMLSNKHIEF